MKRYAPIMEGDSVLKLPTIDFRGGCLKPGTRRWVSACEEVRTSLEEYGCFMALSDSVSEDLLNEVLTCLKDLFGLSPEIKAKNISEKPFQGYFGRRPSSPLLESMGIENPCSLESVHQFASLMWPHGNNDPFCETIHRYVKITSSVEEMVTRMIFESYGIMKEKCEAHIESTIHLLRVMQYKPPKPGESNIGASAHTDKSFLSILHQCQTKGLEVKTKTGVWLSVDFPPSSFFVMAGEACKGWSNGRVHSAEHKVKMDEFDQMRYTSVTLSYNKGMIEVPSELVDDKHPILFKPFNIYDLISFYAENPAKRVVKSIEEFCGI